MQRTIKSVNAKLAMTTSVSIVRTGATGPIGPNATPNAVVALDHVTATATAPAAAPTAPVHPPVQRKNAKK